MAWILTVLFLASPVWALDDSKITLTAPEGRPYTYIENGDIKGLFVDIVREAFFRAHVKIEIKILPWARCMEEVRWGRADGMFVIYKTPEREQYFDFSKEYLANLHEMIYVMNEDDFVLTSDYSRLRDRRIGILNHTKHGDRITQAINDGMAGEVTSVNSYENMAKMLVSGRLDMVLAVSDAMMDAIVSQGLEDRIRQVDPEVDIIPSYLVFTKTRDMSALRDRFDNALHSMRKDGTYERIIADYPPETLMGNKQHH